MNGTMRTIGQMVAAAAVAVVVVGSLVGVAEADQKLPGGFGSRAKFKYECKAEGGTFIDDGLGNLECHFPEGSWTECDSNGNDCWFMPAPKTTPSVGVEDPLGVMGIGGMNTADPTVDSATPSDAGQRVAAPDDDPEPAKHVKGKKGKKGKGRKK